MAGSIHSSSWYRVAGLKPKLRPHAQIHRHHYRDALWYVLQDKSSGRYFRFSSAVNEFVGLMDGERTVEEIWDSLHDSLGDTAPTQDEMIQLLGQLHASDVLQCDVSPDSVELFRRFEKKRSKDWKQRLASPLYLKFPLLNPEERLERWLPLVSPLFTWAGALIWLCVVCVAAALAVSHWSELTHNFADHALAPSNLLILILTYPVIKAVHELGHAFATKIWGGEVHEMGITLLAFMPIPYVDCSSASAFLDKRQRMVVGAAGILVEFFLAALALFIWLNVEPGLVREIAFNVMLIGGVSTLFFNGNPLLRFDGYYVLADAVEIPNLATRSRKYLSYLFVRYVFGVREARSPVTAQGEAGWFLVYGTAAMLYKFFVMFVIVVFISAKFFIIGLMLAAWIIVTQVLAPIVKQFSFVLFSPQIQRQRTRAVATTSLTLVTIVVVLFVLPVPSRTLAEGVVWLPERSQIKASVNGTVVRILADPESRVAAGDPLFETTDPFLPVSVKLAESQLRELTVRYDAQRRVDRVRAQIIKEEMSAIQANLADAKDRLGRLIVRSAVSGNFIVPEAEDLPGRFVKQGETLGYVTDSSNVTARVVLKQGEYAQVRERTVKVEARFSDRIDEPLAATIKREVPAANYLLPSKVLGRAGGGRIPVDPQDSRGTKALQKIFQIDVEIHEREDLPHIGKRVYLRFNHGNEPIAQQVYRSLSRLLLGLLLRGAGV